MTTSSRSARRRQLDGERIWFVASDHDVPHLAPPKDWRTLNANGRVARQWSCYVSERWPLWIPACRLRLPAIQSCCRLSARSTAPSSGGHSTGRRWSGSGSRARAFAGFEGSGVAHPKEADTAALIAALHRAGVRFIVVGGAAAQLHGSTLGTLDLDIVHQRDPANVATLLDVLHQLDAFHRQDLMNRRLRPTAEQLLGSGPINLSTSLGPLDPLCELEPGQGYDELLPHSEVMRDEELEIRVVDLPTLIEIKSKVGRTKDKLVVAELIVILEERQRKP
jgi:hypothetical protein